MPLWSIGTQVFSRVNTHGHDLNSLIFWECSLFYFLGYMPDGPRHTDHSQPGVQDAGLVRRGVPGQPRRGVRHRWNAEVGGYRLRDC